ncbi:MAG: hypothetical protein IT493_05830 [Gammaproteobacteria bacterium]|nr:hypothetical protein [Gammaproteobacteria bacterium]
MHGLAVFGIPAEFILFASTLLGVALFHRHTLTVALTGLAAIVGYKLSFTGFRGGPGLMRWRISSSARKCTSVSRRHRRRVQCRRIGQRRR